MKITKQQLRGIIKEEISHVNEKTGELNEGALTEAVGAIAPILARDILSRITRRAGLRKSMMDYMQAIFKELGGDEADEAFSDFIAEQGPEFLEDSGE